MFELFLCSNVPVWRVCWVRRHARPLRGSLCWHVRSRSKVKLRRVSVKALWGQRVSEILYPCLVNFWLNLPFAFYWKNLITSYTIWFVVSCYSFTFTLDCRKTISSFKMISWRTLLSVGVFDLLLCWDCKVKFFGRSWS